MELNQIGDFLAGVFAPLAFVWIVVGYLQQSEELSLQVKELNAAVHQQAQMVKAAREQIDLEKSSRQQALIMLTSADLPYFEPNLAISKSEQSLDGYNFLLSFINLGEFASEVSITLKVGEGNISSDTHSNIPQGQTIQFFLQTSEVLLTDGWRHIITMISLSAMKKPRVQEFAITGEQYPLFQVCYPAHK